MEERKLMKEKKIRRPSRIAFCFVSFLLIIFMVLNVVITNVVSPYFGFIQNFLTEAPKSNEAKEATAASAEVTKTIEEEGIVLLKNNGSLPLKDEKTMYLEMEQLILRSVEPVLVQAIQVQMFLFMMDLRMPDFR